jgi:hypothetical protein
MIGYDWGLYLASGPNCEPDVPVLKDVLWVASRFITDSLWLLPTLILFRPKIVMMRVQRNRLNSRKPIINNTTRKDDSISKRSSEKEIPAVDCSSSLLKSNLESGSEEKAKLEI